MLSHVFFKDEILLFGGNVEGAGRSKDVYKFNTKLLFIEKAGQLKQERYSGDTQLI